MDLFSVKNLFNEMFHSSVIIYEFDKKCIKNIELNFNHIDSEILHIYYVEFNKVKITIDQQEARYVEISSHREVKTLEEITQYLSDLNFI